ncbi:MAG: hypothetical protein IKP86_07285 [Anaerolineaceae bacterium]|nr:hypothetical protein [Anaerolineaceae bacterium]
MRYSPEILAEEWNMLADKFFSQCPEFIWDHEPTEQEEREFDVGFHQWIYDRASEKLKLWMDYTGWIGDEGQLCDGKGYPLRYGDSYLGWIREWDVSEDGYCLFKGTNELIRNTDGMPIENPVLDPRIADLFDDEDEDVE